MTPIVEFRGVSYRINGHHILRNLSFSLAAGETLVLLGRSGSGKTTALKMVNGLLFPTEGEVCVEGMPTTSWDPIRLKRRIGYVIQEAGLFPHFTVADNVGLVPKLEGWPPSRVRARTGELLVAVECQVGARTAKDTALVDTASRWCILPPSIALALGYAPDSERFAFDPRENDFYFAEY